MVYTVSVDEVITVKLNLGIKSTDRPPPPPQFPPFKHSKKSDIFSEIHVPSCLSNFMQNRITFERVMPLYSWILHQILAFSVFENLDLEN